jgi:excisionase family DNA binding protein
MSTTPASALLTPEEVRRRFGVGRHTVGRWADAGRLTVIHTIGGHRRYLASEVEALAGPETVDLLTAGQVAEIFSVHTATVSRWGKAGRIPAIQTPGGQYRYREADIRALIAEQTTPRA